MDSCDLVFQGVGNQRFSMPGCRATRKNAAAGQGRTFWQYATKKLAAGIEPPSSSRPRLRFLLRCFAPESARGAARSKRMAAAPSAAASAGGVSQGHGRTFSLLIPSCPAGLFSCWQPARRGDRPCPQNPTGLQPGPPASPAAGCGSRFPAPRSGGRSGDSAGAG